MNQLKLMSKFERIIYSQKIFASDDLKDSYFCVVFKNYMLLRKTLDNGFRKKVNYPPNTHYKNQIELIQHHRHSG